MMKAKKRLLKFVRYFLVVGVVGTAIGPFLWMLTSSIKVNQQLFLFPPKLILFQATLGHYKYIFTQTDFLGWMFNSTIVALSVTALAISTSILCAFSLVRYKYRGREFLSMFMLLLYMVPPVMLLIPLFFIIKSLHLFDTLYGLIFTHSAFSIPFCIWMLRSYLMTVPPDMEEAAVIDGCTRLGAFMRITLPILAPAVTATALFSFLLSWNEYLFSLSFVTTDSMKTLPVGIALFIGRWSVRWGEIMSAGVIGIIPAIVLFLFLEKYIVRGLTAGAVKG